MLKNLIVEYCNESSIHGFRYLCDKRKTLLERLFWIVFVTFSILCCCWFTYNLYMNAKHTSIIVTISNRPLPITQLYFPSLTICSTLPFNLSVFNAKQALISGDLKHASKDLNENEVYTLLAQFCNIDDVRSEPLAQFNYMETLLKVNLRLKSYLKSCRFGLNREQCRLDFQEIITNVGLCYVYNSLSVKELFESHNGTCFDFSENLVQITNRSYSTKNIIGPYERGRIDASFSTTSETFQEVCKPHVDGFLVALRSPQDVVVVNSADVRINEDYATDLSLTPQVLESSEELKAYRITDRECYFENERKLHFLRYYTQENCHLECLTNVTLNECGCVLYFMPRLKTTPVCFGARLIVCAEQIEQTYDNLGKGPCHCYPLCNTVTFQVNVATHKLNLNKFRGDTKGKFVETRIAVFTKEKSVYPLSRSQLYGFNDYIANFGGLLGLFLGVSILSIIELLYYIIVRPFALGCCRVARIHSQKDRKKPKQNVLKVTPYNGLQQNTKQQKVDVDYYAATVYWTPYYDFRKE